MLLTLQSSIQKVLTKAFIIKKLFVLHSEFYFWQSVMRAVKKKGRRGVLSRDGVVGYIKLDVHKARNNKPNALNMNFPLQASR